MPKEDLSYITVVTDDRVYLSADDEQAQLICQALRQLGYEPRIVTRGVA